MSRAILFVGLLVAFLTLPFAVSPRALAGATPVEPNRVTHQDATIIKPDGEVIRLDRHDPAAIEPTRSASTVFNADAAIATLQVKSTRLISV